MADAHASRPEEIALLRADMARRGISLREYAETVLIRDVRTVRRWLAGERQIPRAVLELIINRSAK